VSVAAVVQMFRLGRPPKPTARPVPIAQVAAARE
jgi:hypothetical protein